MRLRLLLGRALPLSLALFAILVITQGAARADEVTVSGTTSGSFSGTNINTLGGLTYNSSFFNAVTSNGFLILNNPPNPVLNFNNLGSITLTGPAANYSGNSFTLRVQFNAPGDILGGNLVSLTGSISNTAGGGVFIDFDNTPRLLNFSFSNPDGTINSGAFTFSVGDVTVPLGGTVAITSTFTVPGQVPEPATVTLLGFGLAAAAIKVRRRRRADAELRNESNTELC